MPGGHHPGQKVQRLHPRPDRSALIDRVRILQDPMQADQLRHRGSRRPWGSRQIHHCSVGDRLLVDQRTPSPIRRRPDATRRARGREHAGARRADRRPAAAWRRAASRPARRHPEAARGLGAADLPLVPRRLLGPRAWPRKYSPLTYTAPSGVGTVRQHNVEPSSTAAGRTRPIARRKV